MTETTSPGPRELPYHRLGEFCAYFLRVPAAHIVHIKSLIECYEEVAIVRTLDPREAQVVILTLEDSRTIVEAILTDLTDKLQMRPFTPPKDMSEDWLLATLPAEALIGPL